MYKFIIPETGYKSTYISLEFCRFQAKRVFRSLLKLGLIHGAPSVEIYHEENGQLTFIEDLFKK